MAKKDNSKKMAQLKDLEMEPKAKSEEPDLEDMEMDFEEDMEDDMGGSVEAGSLFADASDEELMAEVEARGLMGDLEGGDDDFEDDFEEEEDEDDEDLDVFDPEIVS